MARHPKFFARAYRQVKTRPVFALAMEGARTEPVYFEAFKPTQRHVSVRMVLVPSNKDRSSPEEVLKRLKNYAKKYPPQPRDNYWIVIDRDGWDPAILDEVCAAAAIAGYEVALSNPCFEIWLWLHLQHNRAFIDRHVCQRALQEVLPGYSPGSKGNFDPTALVANVQTAIARARALDVNPGAPWPPQQASRVYRLVESWINANAVAGG
jgi:hypothetical protein